MSHHRFLRKNKIIQNLLLIFLMHGSLLALPVSAQTPVVQATLERIIETSAFSPPSPDPAGLTYIPDSDRLLICDSEVDEMPPYFAGVNLFDVTLSGQLVGTLTTIPFSHEPTGVSFDPVSRFLFFADDNWGRVFILNPGQDAAYNTADDVVTYFSTRSFGSDDPEDITFDASRGHLLIADGEGTEVYDISPGLNGVFDGIPPAGDDVVTHFDTSALGILDPEGIAFNSENGHLYVMSYKRKIAETTIDGTLLRYIDASRVVSLGAGGGMVYAPASKNPTQKNLYIVARGVDNGQNPLENDGKLYEISFPPLDNPMPSATSLNPASARAGGPAFTLTVNGSNFILSSVVRWNGADRATTYLSPTQLTASIPAADIANSGTANVTVFNPAPGGGTSSAQTFMIDAADNPVPATTSLSPAAATARDATFNLVVNGTGFVSGSIVRWNRADRVTTVDSSTQLTAVILASDIEVAGTASVTVFSPAPGGGTSNAQTFTINAADNPVPETTNLSPASATAGGSGFTLTVNGASFVSVSMVRWNGADRATTCLSATQLTASIPASDIASAGTASVTVFSPVPGGGTSNAQTFTINAADNPVPATTSLSPASATAGGLAFTLTVDGSSFTSSSVVRWNGADRATTYLSATQLTASISASDIASAGTASVTVFNPAPGGGTSNAQTFTISAADNPVPATTSLSPASATAGGLTFTLTVNGSSFISSSVVRWNGADRVTT